MPLTIVKKANPSQSEEINNKTAVITILGIQGQKENIKTKGCAKYYFAGESPDSSQEFFNTLPLLADKFGAENIVPIYTADAREFNEEVMAHYVNFRINFNDSYKITDEKNFEAVFEIFERAIDDLVKGGVGKIVFDVTHGFRHLPLLALVDLLIQNFSNVSQIDQILFAKEIEKSKLYEIIDLRQYLDIANIAFVIAAFSQNYTLAQHIKTKKFEPLVNALNDFSNNILSLNIAKLKSSHGELIKELDRIDDIALISRAKNLKDGLSKICDWSDSAYVFRYKLAKDMFEKGYLLQSLVLLFESVNSYIVGVFERNIPVIFKKILDECSKKKERRNYKISNFFVQALKVRADASNDDFAYSTKRNLKYLDLTNSDIDNIRSVIKTEFGSGGELLEYHEELYKLRNDFAHGNISEEEFSHIKQEIKKLFDRYHNFINIQQSL
ncbi:CRISPR-associated DxTHG motif protein [Campylobacter concisus]|uniref:CRISPR-associated DxTHG motif protein n=1 Tax=Campylobacter concisus TaxID=199 RepID=UPI000CD8534B|nr:TM1812 family CRISPR-associated protein [Campylobacter concisus]